MKQLLKLAPIALLLPTLASASVVWKGDLETGNLSQWDREQSVASNRLMVETSPVHEGHYAMKVTVHQGDNPINASGNRNEVVYLSHEAPGSEYFYKWSTMFPTSFPRSKKWALFTQWHQDGEGGSPPLEFYVVDDVINVRVGGSNGQVLYTHALQREHWNDFVLHVKWSSDPKVGFVELYHDGKLAISKKYVATQFSGQRNYLKMGLYRDASISPEGIVYHDGFTQATSMADVMSLPGASAASPEPELNPEPAPAPEETPVADADPAQGPPDDDGTTQASAGTNTALGTAGLAPDPAAPVAASCGASATGGTPLLLLAALSVLALNTRRKVPARATARASRTPRR